MSTGKWDRSEVQSCDHLAIDTGELNKGGHISLGDRVVGVGKGSVNKAC